MAKTWSDFRFEVGMRLIWLGIQAFPKGTAKEQMYVKFMEWIFLCKKQHEIENTKLTGKVVCQTCRNQFEPIEPDMNQAFGCAADVLPNNTIVGHYGSAVIDMEVWDIVHRHPATKNGIICDDCVNALIHSDMINLKSNAVVW